MGRNLKFILKIGVLVVIGVVLAVLALAALISGIVFQRPGPPPASVPKPTPSASPTRSDPPGVIDLALGSPSFVFRVTGLLPGTSVDADVVLLNRGAGALRYAVTASTTNDDRKGLAAAIILVIRASGGGCRAFDGDLLYDGPLTGAVVGRPAPGADRGDRTFRPGAAETLCLRATLPIDAGNDLQDTSTGLRLTFVAEDATN